MRLIVGGAFQGKLEFAWKLLGREEGDRECYASGDEDSLEAAFERPVVYRFHEYVRRLLAGGQDVGDYLRELEAKNPEAVIVMDEVGYGIVPVDPADRRFREEAGRAGQRLAGNAVAVYRVVCGIGTRIK